MGNVIVPNDSVDTLHVSRIREMNINEQESSLSRYTRLVARGAQRHVRDLQ
jgi:hypothetical protein